MTGAEIRESFLTFFEQKGHRRMRSSPLIPSQDPTLLFTNAGMVQFKDVFLGVDRRDYNRVITSQKCVRAGGKHNDLENVGRTARHHTFFEMLGNFSFGDYFKEEAIHFAWEYLTRTLGLPVEKLWVSVYKEDDEADAIWRDLVGVDRSRIIRLGEKDNFWSMGDTGPCGPCSEIIIDQGEGIGCGRAECAVGCDCDRFLELWNLVFMQFDRNAEGKLTPLPRPSIDTGMGLERLTAVVQGKTNNFETDLFAPLIGFIEGISGVSYGLNEKSDISIRVIADHLRAAVFLVSDGVIPSNEGRGYVLRRIMRRAGRHAYFLNIKEAFLYRGIPTLIDTMGKAYPELEEHAAYSSRMIRQEEQRFMSTLEAGLGILQDVIGGLKKQGKTIIPGETVFRLYDTYGFPLDLSQEMARDEGFSLDMEGFEHLMEDQRVRARAAWVGSGEEGIKESWRSAMEKIVPTDISLLEAGKGTVSVLQAFVGDEEAHRVETGQKAEIFLDASPFYGESGGQVGDTGALTSNGVKVLITGTKRLSDKFIVHYGEVVEGSMEVGRNLQAAVDLQRRAAVSRNHTATHLLQAALRKVLGEHVKQAGSLVSPERLRFDFAHFGPLSAEEKEQVEDLVNSMVLENRIVEKRRMDLDEAVNSGAMAIFGEKYQDEVTVVSISEFSSELCGGIHVGRTGAIGLFKILSESGVAAGVRRIEAVTGESALRAVRDEEKIIASLSGLMKVGRDSLVEKVRKLTEELKETQKLLERSKTVSALTSLQDILKYSEDMSGLGVLVAKVDGLDMKVLRDMIDKLKDHGQSAIVLTSVSGGNLFIVAGATGRALEKVHAGKLVGKLAEIAEGKGGGRPDFGQAGARRVEKEEDVLEAARLAFREMLAGGGDGR